MRTHYHLLSYDYLLTLCADEDQGGLPLSAMLHRALHSGRCNVWVDCSYVPTLPTEVLALLRQCAAQLWQFGGHLILCHLSAAGRASLASCPSQPLAASLLDATAYGLDCPQAPGSGE